MSKELKIKETVYDNNTGFGVTPKFSITNGYNNILVGEYKEQSFFSKIKYKIIKRLKAQNKQRK